MVETTQYTHLASREGSRYQQFFIKGATFGPRPSTAPPWGRSPGRPRMWPGTTTCQSKPSGRLCATALTMPLCSRENARRTGPRAGPAASTPLYRGRRAFESCDDDLSGR